MSRKAIRWISFTAFGAAGCFCLPLVTLVGLADTGAAMNRSSGLTFLVFWLLFLLPAILTYVPWEPVGRWLDRLERWRDARLANWVDVLIKWLPVRKQGPQRRDEQGG
jgi:hypothetical protein